MTKFPNQSITKRWRHVSFHVRQVTLRVKVSISSGDVSYDCNDNDHARDSHHNSNF